MSGDWSGGAAGAEFSDADESHPLICGINCNRRAESPVVFQKASRLVRRRAAVHHYPVERKTGRGYRRVN